MAGAGATTILATAYYAVTVPTTAARDAGARTTSASFFFIDRSMETGRSGGASCLARVG